MIVPPLSDIALTQAAPVIADLPGHNHANNTTHCKFPLHLPTMDATGPEMAAPDVASSEVSSATSPSSVAHSPLFKLPRELRDYIYEYSFCSLYTTTRSGEYGIRVTKEGGIPEPALLLTCKAIRDEAVPLYYGKTRFHLIVRSFDPAVMLLWNAKKAHLRLNYNLSAPWQGLTRTGVRSWDNLKRTLRLVHSGHKLFVAVGPRDGPNFNGQEEFIQGMTKVARSMDDEDWDVVEDTLQMLRHGLVALNPNWAN